MLRDSFTRFLHIFLNKKTLPEPHMKRIKPFEKFFDFVKIFAKNVCPATFELCNRSLREQKS